MRSKLFKSVLVLLVCLSMGLGAPDACIAKSGNCKKITVVKGHTSTIKVKKKYVAVSCNTKIATVTKKGVIKGKRIGKCTIKIKKNGKTVAKYMIKVVRNKELQKSDNNVQTSMPQTPVPQYTQVGGKVFCIGRCIVTSSTKVSDTEYDTAVDLDEPGTKVLGVCFAECANTKHVVIRTDALYDKGAMLNIIVNKDESTYSVINDDTVAIMGYTLSR